MQYGRAQHDQGSCSVQWPICGRRAINILIHCFSTSMAIPHIRVFGIIRQTPSERLVAFQFLLEGQRTFQVKMMQT